MNLDYFVREALAKNLRPVASGNIATWKDVERCFWTGSLDRILFELMDVDQQDYFLTICNELVEMKEAGERW